MKALSVRFGGKTIDIEPTMVDRVVNYFNPVAGRNRLQARLQMAMVGGYTGARRDRKQTQNWATTQTDADSVIIPDLPTLRDRARDLERNAPLACGAIATKTTCVVGTGLKPRAAIDRDVLTGLDDEQADAWERAAMREFQLATADDNWDVENHHNFLASQDLVFRSVLSSGDILVNLPRIKRPGNPYSLRANFIEADRVCNENFAGDSASLVAGVEKDANGAPLAYHVARFHPGNRLASKREWSKLKAFDSQGRPLCLHIYRKRRPGQTRGVPDLAPVVEMLKSFADYTDSELHAAVVSSLFTVFVKSRNPEDIFVDQATKDQRIDTGDMKLGSGSVIGLYPDEDITLANPNRPNTGAGVFLEAMAEQIGVALELPKELLVKHFTASYSAAQAALLEAWRFFLTARAWLAQKYCQPIWDAVITDAIAMGRLPAPGFFSDPIIRRAYLGCEWAGDAKGHIKETEAVTAASARVEGGFSTLAEETTKLTGGDWERNHRQQVKEKKARDRDGLTPVAPAAPAVSVEPPVEADPDDTTDLEDETKGGSPP
jgi:lambda family phage portal protein